VVSKAFESRSAVSAVMLISSRAMRSIRVRGTSQIFASA
jgi:hypothetical protein